MSEPATYDEVALYKRRIADLGINYNPVQMAPSLIALVEKQQAEITRLRGLLDEALPMVVFAGMASALDMFSGPLVNENERFSNVRARACINLAAAIEAEQAEHSPNGEFGFIQHRNPEQAD